MKCDGPRSGFRTRGPPSEELHVSFSGRAITSFSSWWSSPSWPFALSSSALPSFSALPSSRSFSAKTASGAWASQASTTHPSPSSASSAPYSFPPLLALALLTCIIIILGATPRAEMMPDELVMNCVQFAYPNPYFCVKFLTASQVVAAMRVVGRGPERSTGGISSKVWLVDDLRGDRTFFCIIHIIRKAIMIGGRLCFLV